MTTLADNFNRSNSTTGFGTPSDGLAAWSDEQGTSGISSNKGYFPTLVSSRAYAVRDSGSNIGKVQYTDGASGNMDVAAVIRYIDINNFIFFHQSNGNSTLQKRVSGSFTTLSNVSNTFVSGAVYSIEVDINNVIICKANGVTIHTVTDAANSTGTKVGMRSALSSVTFDDWSFTDAAGGGTQAITPSLFTNSNTFYAAVVALANQIVTPSLFTNSNTFYAATVAGTAGNITLTDLTNHRIYQRIAGAKTLAFSGAYTNTAGASVEVQLYAADGTTVLSAWAPLTSASITGGTWSGNLAVPQGGMYRFAARFKDGGGTVIKSTTVSTNTWGVGDLVLAIGSSSAVKWCDASSGTGFTGNANVRQYDTTNAWVPAGTIGSMVTVANNLNSALGVPIGIIQAGVGGSKLSTWSDNTSFDYTAFQTKLTAIGGKLGLACVTVGSNDASSGIVVSYASHLAMYLQFIANIRSDTGQASLPFFISGSSSRDGMDGNQADWIREVEMALEGYSNVYFASTNVDLEIDPADNIHLTVAGYTNSLARMALTHTDIFGSGTYHRGPQITGYTYAGSSATVNIAHQGGSNLSVNAAHGFVASDGSGTLAISSVTVATSTSLTVTFGRAISGNCVLRYAHGTRPMESTQGVHDNSALTLPLEVAPDIATTITASLFTNTNTFYAATISAVANIAAAIFNNSNTFYVSTVTPTYGITPNRFDNTNTFYGATISSPQTVSAARFDNTNAFYGATVSLANSPQTITATRFNNTNTFYGANLTTVIGCTRFDNPNTYYGATINQSGFTQGINGTRFDNGNAFYNSVIATPDNAVISPSYIVKVPYVGLVVNYGT